MKINELTFEEILKLRREIVLGSIFTYDYTNTFDIDPDEVINYFDGYIEYLEELRKEAQDVDQHWTDFDNEYNLRAWYSIAQ